ncbi:MAG: ribonuclease R [Pseudomonadota bacterium]
MTKPTFNDPYADREADNYDAPVPSREFLLEFITEQGVPLSHGRICELLELEESQSEGVRRRLRAMLRDGQLSRGKKNSYIPFVEADSVQGHVIGHRDGFGFVKPLDGSDDVFLPFGQMRSVFDGDEVMVDVIHTDKKGKREGRLNRVIQHNTHTVIGRLEQRDGQILLLSDNQRITQDIVVSKESTSGIAPGVFVSVHITQQPQRRKPAFGEVTDVLGEHMGPGTETDIALHSHNIPHVFPSEVVDEAEQFADEPTETDKQGRVDLRKLPLVTIDGEDARDFDDAVYCKAKTLGGWVLYVAIADVSHYVSPQSPLDQEALLRSTSVYFPSRVVPMLPEALSNGLCSLNPAVDRLCMVCEMTFNAKGKMTSYQFYEAVMHSHARLTYTQVGAMLDEHAPDKALRKEYKHVVKELDALFKLYQALAKARHLRGAMEFETSETRMEFGDDKKISNIVPVVRNDAHKLIEECMLSANVAAAQFLEKHKLPALYRVHESPQEKKIDNLRTYLGELGLELKGGDKPTPNDYRQLALSIKERDDATVIQTMMLRSMNQANYQVENLGHFGLAYEAYAHFTSPIRRYPDLMVHRAIRSVINSKQRSKHVKRPRGFQPSAVEQYPFNLEQLIVIGEQASMAERRADDASRDVASWLKCEYLKDHIGEEHGGVITAVTSFGFFVELNDIFVEGLVHIKQLKSDYFSFDQAGQRLIGETHRQVYKLGDSVDVRVLGVNLDERKIDFELTDDGAVPRKKNKSHKKKGVKKAPIKKKRSGKKRPPRKSSGGRKQG